LNTTIILRRALLAVLLAWSAAACAAQTGGNPPATYNRDVITRDELAAVEARTTALQLIQRMRPAWLQGRGPSGIRGQAAPVVVYVNSQRASESPLPRYTAGELLEIRFLNATDATARFGTGHGSGAILLTTR
jgi:hypothetical protein